MERRIRGVREILNHVQNFILRNELNRRLGKIYFICELLRESPGGGYKALTGKRTAYPRTRTKVLEIQNEILSQRRRAKIKKLPKIDLQSAEIIPMRSLTSQQPQKA
ncbi:hypothetical protein CHS0354_003141 [Potamilus streckersoni]|uniref:Uncharacterized protein n=1 Tax=Potamilus streckersoni TaxID=2493646 RepID=A0AAE0RPC5_9BIVA|nr:hypothetical protein CHS0354_003141 [Potamilus streckersoni]